MAPSRVLVTGGAGTIGAAVVRRLVRDADWEVRVSDQREAPVWMREGCEVHTGDLRQLSEARKAIEGCSHVIHLAAIVGGIANFHKLPHTLTAVNSALYHAVIQASLDHGVARFVYVSSSMVFERATQFPTTEEHVWEVAMPQSAYGFSKLTGEVWCRAAHDEHGLPFTICRPFNAYGPGELPGDEPGIAHADPRAPAEQPLGLLHGRPAALDVDLEARQVLELELGGRTVGGRPHDARDLRDGQLIRRRHVEVLVQPGRVGHRGDDAVGDVGHVRERPRLLARAEDG